MKIKRWGTDRQETYIDSPEFFITELDSLQRQDSTLIFRGQPSSEFRLQPSVFRVENQERFRQVFGEVPYEVWCCSKEIKKKISLYLKNPACIYSAAVQRVLELTIYTLQYNYLLAKYVRGSQEEDFDFTTIEMYKARDLGFWAKEETFLHAVDFDLRAVIALIGLDGEIIKSSIIHEAFASYDDTLPQHYGVLTAALDWSRNPYIALFFAIQNIPENTNIFAVYVYKERNRSKANPIIITEGHPECKNRRIKRQEGCFTRFQYARLYYFLHGAWPSIEDYITFSPGNFELIKYDIPVSHIPYLKSLLIEKGITKDYLFPDGKNSEVFGIWEKKQIDSSSFEKRLHAEWE